MRLEIPTTPVTTLMLDPKWTDMDHYMELFFIRDEYRVTIAEEYTVATLDNFYKYVCEMDASKQLLAFRTIHSGNHIDDRTYSDILQHFFAFLSEDTSIHYDFGNAFTSIKINSADDGILVNVDGKICILATDTYFPSAYILSLLRDSIPIQSQSVSGLQNLKYAAYNLEIKSLPNGKATISKETFLYK